MIEWSIMTGYLIKDGFARFLFMQNVDIIVLQRHQKAEFKIIRYEIMVNKNCTIIYGPSASASFHPVHYSHHAWQPMTLTD